MRYRHQRLEGFWRVRGLGAMGIRSRKTVQVRRAVDGKGRRRSGGAGEAADEPLSQHRITGDLSGFAGEGGEHAGGCRLAPKRGPVYVRS